MSLVGDYVNTRMVTCDSKASVRDVAGTMAERNVSSVAITITIPITTTTEAPTGSGGIEKKKVVGILTERDLVRGMAKGVPPDGVTAGSLMSSPLLSIGSDATVEEAARLMIGRKVRHLLVEDPASHEVTGIISTTDLARYLKQKMIKAAAAAATTTAAPATGAAINEEEIIIEHPSPSAAELVSSEVWELFF